MDISIIIIVSQSLIYCMNCIDYFLGNMNTIGACEIEYIIMKMIINT